MVEIYNEQVRDLLSSNGPQKRYPFPFLFPEPTIVRALCTRLPFLFEVMQLFISILKLAFLFIYVLTCNYAYAPTYISDLTYNIVNLFASCFFICNHVCSDYYI